MHLELLNILTVLATGSPNKKFILYNVEKISFDKHRQDLYHFILGRHRYKNLTPLVNTRRTFRALTISKCSFIAVKFIASNYRAPIVKGKLIIVHVPA